MIKEVFLFKNGNVAVINENGEQLTQLQKLLSDKNIKWYKQ